MAFIPQSPNDGPYVTPGDINRITPGQPTPGDLMTYDDNHYYEDAENNPAYRYNTEHLRLEFTSSAAYKSVYRAFESSQNSEVWLNKLQQIVDSLNLESRNFWSDVTNTFGNTYAKQYTEALNQAYASLQQLYDQWFEWQNSLPSTQRSQYADAGINVALDGGSQITGSVAPSRSIEPISTAEVSNQAFDNALNFVTATSGGLLDLVNLVNGTFRIGLDFNLRNRSLDIQEKSLKQTGHSKIQDLNLQRGQLGLSPISDLSQFDNGVDNGFFELRGKNFYANEAANFRAQYDAWKEQSTFNAFQQNIDGFGAYSDIMKEIGNINLSTRLYNELVAAEKSKFEKAKAEYELKRQNSLNERSEQIIDAELDEKFSNYTESTALSDFHKQLIDYKKSVLSDWIYEANNNKALGWLYSSVLMKSDLNLSEFMSPADAGLRYLNSGSDFLGDLLSELNPLAWFKALKKGPSKLKK